MEAARKIEIAESVTRNRNSINEVARQYGITKPEVQAYIEMLPALRAYEQSRYLNTLTMEHKDHVICLGHVGDRIEYNVRFEGGWCTFRTAQAAVEGIDKRVK